MNQLVDTHCHIQSAGLTKGERITRQLWAKSELKGGELVKRAKAAGVTRLLCIGCDLEDSRLAVEFAQRHNGCWASIGIHPHEAQHHRSGEKLAQFAGLADQPKVVAIGECGLDYYYEHSPKTDQLGVLEFQLELAQEADLPVIFHVREAFDDFWPVFDRHEDLNRHEDLKGVLHSFTDGAANLQKGLERGLFIGVNGIATFTKDRAQLEIYKRVPLEKLLLETDAPFLTPHPYRGSINEPAKVTVIAEFLAALRGETPEQIAKVTTANAKQLFRI